MSFPIYPLPASGSLSLGVGLFSSWATSEDSPTVTGCPLGGTGRGGGFKRF